MIIVLSAIVISYLHCYIGFEHPIYVKTYLNKNAKRYAFAIPHTSLFPSLPTPKSHYFGRSENNDVVMV